MVVASYSSTNCQENFLAMEGRVVAPTFAFLTSPIAAGGLPHHHLHGLPVSGPPCQNHCVHPSKLDSITCKVTQNKMCPQLRQDSETSAQIFHSRKLLLITCQTDFSRIQTTKQKSPAAIHGVQLWSLCSLQTHLITIKLIIIWDKQKVSKFLLFTFFFPKMQINKSINMLLKANYKESANLGTENILQPNNIFKKRETRYLAFQKKYFFKIVIKYIQHEVYNLNHFKTHVNP